MCAASKSAGAARAEGGQHDKPVKAANQRGHWLALRQNRAGGWQVGGLGQQRQMQNSIAVVLPLPLPF